MCPAFSVDHTGQRILLHAASTASFHAVVLEQRGRPAAVLQAEKVALRQVAQALAKAESGWVLDGNYSRTKTIKWESVDWVVWVDYGFCRTLFQAVRRAATRAWQGTELWPGTGNRESFRRSFFSRDSIVLWTIKTYRKNRAGYLADMNDARYRHIRFIQLRSPAHTEKFLRALSRQ